MRGGCRVVGWGGGGTVAQRGGGGAAAVGRGRPAQCAFGHARIIGRAFMSFLRVLRTLWDVACAHRVAQTFSYMWVCLLCVCGSGIFSPLHPLPSSG